MLQELAAEELPWTQIHLFQIDERIAPEGDKDRNLTHLLESFSGAPIPPKNIHPMPVNAVDPAVGAKEYEQTLEQFCGIPPVLDLAHLGLGPDGHTASLIPGDPVLKVTDRDVALTGVYQNRRRMTLTYPLLNRARRILWVVTGAEKAEMLVRLQNADSSIPAGTIHQENALVQLEMLALVLADRPAAGNL